MKSTDTLIDEARIKVRIAIVKKCDRLIILNNISYYIKTKKFFREFTEYEKRFIIREHV